IRASRTGKTGNDWDCFAFRQCCLWPSNTCSGQVSVAYATVKPRWTTPACLMDQCRPWGQRIQTRKLDANVSKKPDHSKERTEYNNETHSFWRQPVSIDLLWFCQRLPGARG